MNRYGGDSPSLTRSLRFRFVVIGRLAFTYLICLTQEAGELRGLEDRRLLKEIRFNHGPGEKSRHRL